MAQKPPSRSGPPRSSSPASSRSPSPKSGVRADARSVSLEAGRALQRALDAAPAAEKAVKVEGASRKAADAALAAASSIELHIVSSPIRATDIARRIEELRHLISMTTPRAFGERVQAGDEVELDLIGYIGGEIFFAVQGEWYEVAPNPFLPGLFESLVNVAPPDNCVVQVKLPDDYPVAAHRGRMAAFAVTVRRAQERIMPEADDPIFVQLTGRKVKTRKELEDKLVTEMMEERARLLVDEAKVCLLRDLYIAIGLHDVVPDALIEEELRGRWKKKMGDAMAQAGVALDDQKKSFASFCTGEIRAEARRTVWELRVLDAIAETLPAANDEAEVHKMITALAPDIRRSDLDALLYQHASLQKEIVKNFRLHRALLALLGKAKIAFDGTPSTTAPVLRPLVENGSGATTPSGASRSFNPDITAARGLRRPTKGAG